nr:nodulation protein [Melilotus officinalis]
MAMQPRSSSSSCSNEFTYQVFLSFRGPDTRYRFTGNLYKALTDKGIHTFIDDRELQRGGEIKPSLDKAIEESRIFVPVFSANYASSSFCLDELVQIIHCYKTKGRLVLPIFYGVDPSHVRHHRGSYGEALDEHEKRFENNKDNMERLQKWKIALTQTANLSGYHHCPTQSHRYATSTIVEYISNKINRVSLHVANYPIGIQSRVQQVKLLLDNGSDDGVHMVGIYGTGGLGKSTLARAIYNVVDDQFDGLCFLHNVRENSTQNNLKHLQEELLLKIVGLNIKIGDVNEGIPIIKERLCRKKIFLILDDVDELKQLQILAGGLDWFGPGSRVIITTRDKHLLTSHGIQRMYAVKELNGKESLELLRWTAFQNNKVHSSYEDILKRVVAYASGFPLVIEIVGSNLFGKCIEDWRYILDGYKKIPNKEIQKILKVSFDALEEEEKSREGMGKEIVRQESPKKLEKRSRLWLQEDLIEVLDKNTESSDIEIIYLNSGSTEAIIDWNGKAFEKMKNLKTLIIKSGNFFKGSVHFPSNLRILTWEKYHSKCIPSSILNKKFESMKVLKFDNCEYLTEISDLSCLPNLENLSFKNCKNLITIHNSIGLLNKLEFLNASGCIKLKSFPPLKLTSLKDLNLSRCKCLRRFPEILGKIETMNSIDIWETSIEDFPISFQNLTGLTKISIEGLLTWFNNEEELDLDGSNFKILLDCLKECCRLREAHLFNYKSLKEIRGITPNLVIFDALNCKSLNSSSRSMLLRQDLHEGRRTHFCFPLGRERIPKWFEHQSIGPKGISFWFRKKIASIALFFSIGRMNNPKITIQLRVNLFINDHKYTFYVRKFILGSLFVSGHIYLFYLDLEGLVHCSDNYEKLESKLEEALFKNEWIHIKIKFDSYTNVTQKEFHKVGMKLFSTRFGIHVVKVENNLEDIEFINPYIKSKSDAYLNTSLSKFLPFLKKQRCLDMEVIETEYHQQSMCLSSLKVSFVPLYFSFYLFVFSFIFCFGGFLIFFLF